MLCHDSVWPNIIIYHNSNASPALDTPWRNRHMTKPGQWNRLMGFFWNPKKEKCSFYEVDSYQDAVKTLCVAWSPPTKMSCLVRAMLLTLSSLLWAWELWFVPSAQLSWVQIPILYPWRLLTHFVMAYFLNTWLPLQTWDLYAVY